MGCSESKFSENGNKQNQENQCPSNVELERRWDNLPDTTSKEACELIHKIQACHTNPVFVRSIEPNLKFGCN